MKKLQRENQLWQNGFVSIAGVDEVGRGPLAGPVYACAVIFPRGFYLPGVDDSKKIPEQKRDALAEELKTNALAWSIGIAGQQEIDSINIRQATFTAMRRALAQLKIRPDYILIDGENVPGLAVPSEGIIKGDQNSFTIAAASIIAKVERDIFMRDMAEIYPEYNFAKNKGYGTREHIEAIRINGCREIHRKSFLKNINGDSN